MPNSQHSGEIVFISILHTKYTAALHSYPTSSRIFSTVASIVAAHSWALSMRAPCHAHTAMNQDLMSAIEVETHSNTSPLRPVSNRCFSIPPSLQKLATARVLILLAAHTMIVSVC